MKGREPEATDGICVTAIDVVLLPNDSMAVLSCVNYTRAKEPTWRPFADVCVRAWTTGGRWSKSAMDDRTRQQETLDRLTSPQDLLPEGVGSQGCSAKEPGAHHDQGFLQARTRDEFSAPVPVSKRRPSLLFFFSVLKQHQQQPRSLPGQIHRG